jgi:hypothetical protein
LFIDRHDRPAELADLIAHGTRRAIEDARNAEFTPAPINTAMSLALSFSGQACPFLNFTRRAPAYSPKTYIQNQIRQEGRFFLRRRVADV